MVTQEYTSQASTDMRSRLQNSIGSLRDLARAAIGASLAFQGLKRRGRLGLGLGMLGANMFVKSARRMPIANRIARQAREKISRRDGHGWIMDDRGHMKDLVQEASEQSFPASDAPGYW